MVFLKFLFRVLFFLVIFMTLGCASKKTILELKEELRNCQLNRAEIDSHQVQIRETIDSLIFFNTTLEKQNNSNSSEMILLENSIKDKEMEISEMNRNYRRFASSYDSLRRSNNTLNAKLFQKMSFQQKAIDSVTSLKEISKIDFNLIEGRVAFYCPKEMEYQKSHSVVGLIADVVSNEDARSILINRIKTMDETLEISTLEDNSTLIQKIQYYNLVELILEKGKNNGFEIRKIHTSDKQEVKSNMQGWHWEVTPMETEPNQKLILTVLFLDENGIENYHLTKSYQINVKVKSSRFLANLRNRFIEDTEWTIGTIVIPFLTFLFGKRWRKKKRKIKELKKTL